MANILLIDDDDLVAEGLAEVLRRAGHSVAAARTGHEALSVVGRLQADLVITDVLMPGMDGIELIRALRSHSYRMPIIAMSGGGLLDARTVLDMASALGATAVLTKPIKRQELLPLVDRCLAAPQVKL